MADHAITTSVAASGVTALEVPGTGLEDWMTITPVGAIWCSPWGADAVVGGDNNVFIPAGVSRTFRWQRDGVNAISASGTVNVVVEVWRDIGRDAQADYPAAP